MDLWIGYLQRRMQAAAIAAAFLDCLEQPGRVTDLGVSLKKTFLHT
jgi:hypothetical protein